MITPKGFLRLKKVKLIGPYGCAICDAKIKEGLAPLTNEYGFAVLCQECFDKGFRFDRGFRVVHRYHIPIGGDD